MLKTIMIIIGITAGMILLYSCDAQETKIYLPPPESEKGVSVEKALSKRRSVRDYTEQTLDLQQISQLLWSAQGITSDRGGRTAPSAGATYPLEIYLVVNKSEMLTAGVYHYDNKNHSIQLVKKGSWGKKLSQASLGQASIEQAPVDIIITAVVQRTAERYGKRAERYVYMEAGHVSQNIYLQAESLGLGTVVIGAFHDNQVQKVMGIEEEVMSIMPIGRKK
ncbi:MAG: SagB/ThcOx family dehydrogenase [bacterium]